MITHRHRARILFLTICAALAMLAVAPAADAANLLLLNSESLAISGNQSYGIVYVDGELRLTGDTTISAGSIYFGPDADILTCDIEPPGAGTGTNACTTGRSLTLSSPGQITLANGIDLTAGAGTIRSAGSLNVSGGQVAIGGDVNTSASGGGTSGTVTISSGAGLDVGAINAPGAAVTLNAVGSIDVGGDIQTQGVSGVVAPSGPLVQSASPVSIVSTGGDVRVNGAINASGRDAPGNGGFGLGGGFGAAVTVSGSDVRVGAIDATGGTSTDYAAGLSAPISLSARGSLSALGRLDASGQNGKVAGSPGQSITATAGGPLVVAGGAFSGGAQGAGGGTLGATISLQGQTVDAGQLVAAGGDAPNSGSPSNGAAGGTVTVVGTARASVGAIDASGGNATASGAAAPGGSVSVRSDAGSIATGSVNTSGGGNSGGGSGAAGGPISLSAQTNLTAGASLNSSGANANGNANPAFGGGNAATIYLRAATGTLTLGGPVRAQGGNGAANSVNTGGGGAGGNGARVDVVAHALGSIVSIVTDGGDGGGNDTTQGPGGAGGAIFGWTDAPLFDDQKVVTSDGGMGHPVGGSGGRTAEMSPTGVVIDPVKGLLSFTPRSPDAGGYQILRSVFGGLPTVVGQTTQTTGVPIDAPVCVPTTFSVVAVQSTVNWVSDPAPVVAYLKPPSATQGCTAPPTLKLSKTALTFSLKKLKHLHYKATLKATTSGIGALAGTLTGRVKKGKKTSIKTLLKLTSTLTKPGSVHLNLALPLAARVVGKYTLKVVTTSPDGQHKTTTTFTVVITK